VSRAALYEAALCAAFWAALAGFRPRTPSDAARFALGLALGAALARAGGLLLVPAGVLLLAPLWGRARYLERALPALPLAFGVAKLGCLAAGCCAAAAGEALGFAGVQLIARRCSPRHAAAASLAGIAAVRFAVLPLRPEARLSALFAFVWLAAAALRCRPSDGGDRCPRPGSATSSRTAASSRRGCAGSSPAPRASR
jgi:hypothetical protein